MYKNENRPLSITMHKTQIQMDERTEHTATLNLLKEKVGSTLEHIGTGDH